MRYMTLAIAAVISIEDHLTVVSAHRISIHIFRGVSQLILTLLEFYF